MWRIGICLLIVSILFEAPAGSQGIAFPKDSAVLNAKTDCGAKGDGIADDTAALQHGIDESCGMNGKSKVLFLPKGVYRVTQSLVVKNALGPWLYGESRDGVIIRLADGAKECTAVLRTHPKEKGPTSADWFMRNLRNFTIDVGNNPGTDGIRYHATNSGILKNVRVIGHGKIGINAGFLDQSGPNLIQDAVVEGFETGIQSQWIWGETLSRITIRNCTKQGIYINATPVAIEDLTVENTPIGVFCDHPNDWYHWGGVAAIVGAKFTGGNPSGAAIVNRSIVYLRNVKTRGFKTALQNEDAAKSVVGPDIDEYAFGEVKRLFDSPPRALNLPIKREPVFAWESNWKNWVCANEFGATAGDNRDDTEAIQKAIDAAAAAKKTVVTLRGIGGGDPNWYNVDGEIHVHGSVRYILGLGFGRIVAGKGGRFVVDDASAPIVKFQNIDSFGGAPVTLENRSTKSTMIVESCGVKIVGTGTGDIFATDCPCSVDLQHPGQKMWARQLNPEGNDDIGLVRNNGADLWDLGLKCEGQGVRVLTTNHGRTEVFGAFLYDPGDMKNEDRRPMFDIVNSSLTVMGLREIAFGGAMFTVKVRERRGDVIRTLGNDREGGWIGWSLYSGWSRAGAVAEDADGRQQAVREIFR